MIEVKTDIEREGLPMVTKKPKPAREGNVAAANLEPQETAASPLVPAPHRMDFVTEENSPFKDGYSITGEQEALAEFFKTDMMDDTHPMYDRYIEWIDRKDRLEAMQRRFDDTKGAPPIVSRDEARGIDALGSLVDEAQDQMTLHTKQAYRAFMGRRYNPVTGAQPIPGGRMVASALRNLWNLTARDNPYADWALVRHEQTIEQLRTRLDKEIERAEDLLEQQKARGLAYSVLRSSKPQRLNLGYASPYGYAVSNLMVRFDYFVRLQVTIARKSLDSDQDTRAAIARLTTLMRRIFNETERFNKWLMRDQLTDLSRADFLPGADEEAVKRVEFVTAAFGIVPAEVFTGDVQPSHSRRHLSITPAERRVLQDVAEKLRQRDVAEPDAEAGEA